MTIRMPIDESNGMFYDWVGTFYKVARTYDQYRINWESRKRFLDLRKMEREGRVRRTKHTGGFIYNDFKLKHSFYVENLLVSNTARSFVIAQRQDSRIREELLYPNSENGRHHEEIDHIEGEDLL